MITVDTSSLGSVQEAAEAVAAVARTLAVGSGERVIATWNDTPMDANPKDDAKIIHLRWYYERILHQLKFGDMRVSDLP